MPDLMLYHDGGHGITHDSLEYWNERMKPMLQNIGWRPHQVTTVNTGLFSTELFGFDKYHNMIVILFSGFSCGYGGTGPHGLVKLLMDLGIPRDEAEKKVFVNPLVTFIF
ncbi:MAG: hypothetical protein ACTSWA_05270 [Candidatus Thorarchaeota archaeon]